MAAIDEVKVLIPFTLLLLYVTLHVHVHGHVQCNWYLDIYNLPE